MEVGVHGTARPRRWDAVAAAEAPGLAAREIGFTALPDGTLLVEQDVDAPPEALSPLAEAVEASLPPPYRAEAVRRDGEHWAVAARTIEVVELPRETQGDEIVLSVNGDERVLKVDDMPSFGSLPALERLGASRHDAYVVRATRLDGDLWEVSVSAL
jgi:hypothetical protein